MILDIFFVKNHLLDWQFYVFQTVRQWDISYPDGTANPLLAYQIYKVTHPPVQRQAITWTNADSIINWTFRKKLQWNLN